MRSRMGRVFIYFIGSNGHLAHTPLPLPPAHSVTSRITEARLICSSTDTGYVYACVAIVESIDLSSSSYLSRLVERSALKREIPDWDIAGVFHVGESRAWHTSNRGRRMRVITCVTCPLPPGCLE